MNSKRGWFLGALAAGLVMLAGCGTQTAGGVTVEGKLLDLCGQPLAYKTVFVAGHDPVLTGSDGSFTIEGVQTPYDLIISNAYLMPEARQEIPVLIYAGLTKTEPVLWASDAGVPGNDRCAHASVSGSITPTQSSDEYRNGAALVLGPYVSADDFAYSADPSYNLNLYFDPDRAGDATLLGLQWRRDLTSGNATAFLAAKRTPVTLEDGGAVNQDLALEGIQSRDLSVGVELPEVMSLEEVAHYVTLDGKTLPLQTASLDPDQTDANGRFQLVGPVGAGTGSAVVAWATYGGLGPLGRYGSLDLSGIEGYASAWQQVPAEDNAVTLSLPDPLVPIAPLNGATIDFDTAFSWAGPEGALYDVIIGLDQPGPDVSVEVITSRTKLQLPDLSDMGMRFDNALYGYWALVGFGGAAVPGSADDLASPESIDFLAPLYLEFQALQGASGYFESVDAGEFTFPGGAIK
ncbi:hypothetical protein ACMC9I_09845 [Deinococcota bacterium DY0809b]